MLHIFLLQLIYSVKYAIKLKYQQVIHSFKQKKDKHFDEIEFML